MVRNFYLFCLFFCGSFCYGDWVLPVFSNEWFLDQPGSISFYIDSCGNKAYAYKNDDTVPEPLAKSALSNPFFEENCKWGGVYQSHQEVMTKPLSFPGTEED